MLWIAFNFSWVGEANQKLQFGTSLIFKLLYDLFALICKISREQIGYNIN